MIGKKFRARARAPDDLQQQQQQAKRQQHIAQRHRPFHARHQRQGQQRLDERHIAHQQGDDVVDRERNQKQRETDHGHRRGLLFNSLFGRIHAALRLRRVHRAARQDSFFAFKT